MYVSDDFAKDNGSFATILVHEMRIKKALI